METWNGGGKDMAMQQNEIYSELRKTREELVLKLKCTKCSPLAKPFIEEELKDIETTLNKLEKGTFGTCEISGEIIPDHLLSIVPTLKSLDDCKTIDYIIHHSYK
jgi:hypothetical protein